MIAVGRRVTLAVLALLCWLIVLVVIGWWLR